MKHIIAFCVIFSTYILAQDIKATIDQEPQLPGWGVYVGGAFGGAAFTEDAPDGHKLKSRSIGPNIGISKGLFLGGFPLIVGAGYHPRGANYEFEVSIPQTEMTQEVKVEYTYEMLDVWATVPYPVSDRAIVQAGFLLGTCIGGKADDGDSEVDLKDSEGELDYGIMLGGGFAITEQIGVNFGYYIGLSEFPTGNTPYDLKFNGLVFNVGYTF